MIKENKKIIIFAAGTGGHIYPGLSIANFLKSKNISVLWIGTKNGMEKKIVESSGIPIKFVNFSGIRGKGLLTYIKLPFKLSLAIYQAFTIVKEFKPNAVISMGGYISFPCSIASYILKKKIIIHEQNIVFGMTNNILRFFSDQVFLGFPMKIKNEKYKFLGNPSRYENSQKIEKKNNNEFNILVIGGSLGAKVFNEVIPQSIYELKNKTKVKINVIHQTGKTFKIADLQYKNIDVNVVLKEYIENMEDVYKWCDVIVCRGGAITLTEVINLSIPPIIVPFPHSVDDHQMKNSQYLEGNKAAIVINQKNFTQKYLTSIFLSLIENKNLKKDLKKNISKLNKKNATKNICEEIIQIINDN